MAELTDREERRVETPFGEPSAPYVTGTLRGRRVAFLARHGAGHRLLPSELNFRANIYGFKTLGVEWILSASAVGSLREDYKPLDLVIPDQFFDRTRGRVSTFFGDGLVAHVGFAHPFCAPLERRRVSRRAGRRRDRPPGGTYVCMEGPQFSTMAESKLYRAWGIDIIGMTNLQEAKLAREAEICYTTHRARHRLRLLASGPRSVTVEMIVANLMQNAKTAQQVIADAVDRAADRARVRVRERAEARDHHAARGRAGGRQARPGADRRQVSAELPAASCQLSAEILLAAIDQEGIGTL